MIRITLVQAWPQGCDERMLDLPAGATVADALRAAGLPPATDCGVFGHRRTPETVLHPDDRLELYRPLTVDPKDARRRRAELKRRRGAAG